MYDQKRVHILYFPSIRFMKSNTRQLPMGAGHCPWGGYTDQIVCNIHEAPRSDGLGATGLHRQTNGFLGNIKGYDIIAN